MTRMRVPTCISLRLNISHRAALITSMRTVRRTILLRASGFSQISRRSSRKSLKTKKSKMLSS